MTTASNRPSQLIVEVFRAISPPAAAREQQAERSEAIPGHHQAKYLSAALGK